MQLSFYNTLTRKKEAFSPLKKDSVRVYACGPTVYWFAHIGNMRAFLFVDVLQRTLKYAGYNIHFVMNITDVGHLTDDADTGEDKMLLAMKREGKTAYQIAEFYTDRFMSDLKKLHIEPAREYPKATEHIQEQIEMIQAIERNGFTYQTSDGMYFDTSKLSTYGILSGQKSDEKKAGARVDMKKKKHPTDFALWKFSPDEGKREMEWDSPWGVGFPGWHIECSAMSKKYLGFPFDIHTGGVDHIAVHHENELAQSVGCCGVYEAQFWMHSEFLTMDGGKMSKSLGNLFTLSDLETKGFDPLAYRYFVLGAQYRTKLNFTFEALQAAQHALRHLQEVVRDWDQPRVGCAEYEERFAQALADDLNTPQALAVVWELIDDAVLPTSAKAESLLKFDQVLGLGLHAFVAKPLEIPEDIRVLVEQREQARSAKHWKESDTLRSQIEAQGFEVEDTTNGPKICLKY